MERKTNFFRKTERISIRREWLKKKLKRQAEARGHFVKESSSGGNLAHTPHQEVTQDPELLADFDF